MLAEISLSASLFIVTVVTAVVLFFRDLIFGRNDRTPPGPVGLPIVGYLPFLTEKPYIKFQELSKKYGPVYSLRLGTKYVVILCDYKSIKDAFSKDEFMGRPVDTIFELNDLTKKTEAMTGMKWKEHRKFSVHVLRDLGFGKTRMEAQIREEICEVLELIEMEEGKPILVEKFLSTSMSNNIASLMFGKRMRYDDPQRILLSKIIGDIGRGARQASLVTFIPQLRPLIDLFKSNAYSKFKEAIEEMKTFIRSEIAEHKRTFDRNNIRDFIDSYLLEAETRKDDPENSFLEPVMVDVVRIFFGAGSETVRVATQLLLLLVAEKQDVQKKIHEEIDKAFGHRFPTRADYKSTPYTEAVILELMRWRFFIPVSGALRSTLKDTELYSYAIPKGAYVIPNLWTPLHDPTFWGEDAEEFRPERFLSKDGKDILRHEHFIPFSIGKRSCPGEALAKVEVYLYLTAILQKFHVKLPPGVKLDFEGTLGIGLQPDSKELIFEAR